MSTPAQSITEQALRILVITSEWPTPERLTAVPFVVRSVDSLRRAGYSVEVFHFHGGQRPINYFRAWHYLRYKLSYRHYDLLHAQWGQSGLLALGQSKPFVVTYRGSDLEGIIGPDGSYTRAGRLLQLASKFVALMAKDVIAVSEKLARHIPWREVHIIPSGIDLEHFQPMPKEAARRQLGLPLNKKLVLFAADPRDLVKRYALAEATISELQAHYDVELIVTKGVPHAMMPLYMNACDVLLLTSKHEGSPNVVKEALACNLPVVSTDVGDVRRRIGTNEGCAVVQEDTPEALAQAVARLWRRSTCFEGRTLVADLDEQVLTAEIIQIYRRVLAI